MAAKTRQVIEIDVTWSGWSALMLKRLIEFLATREGLDIERISVREVKKK